MSLHVKDGDILNTWLPYDNYAESADILTDRHIFMQLQDCTKLLYWLTEMPLNRRTPSKAQLEHPCVIQWRGYVPSLYDYTLEIMMVAYERSSLTNKQEQISEMAENINILDGLVSNMKEETPSWLGNEDYHLSHKSNLIRLSRSAYESIWPDVPDNLELIWPKGKKVPIQ